MPRDIYKLGDIIYGRYKIQRVIGRGAVGIVYLSSDLEENKQVAIKILDPSVLNKEAIVRRFLRESRLISQLKSPNTVRFFNTGTTAQNLPFIAMEYVDGDLLQSVLRKEGIIPPERAVSIITQVLNSLAEAHALNVVHRDVKPANIMVLKNSEKDSPFVKLLDFGVSSVVTDEADTGMLMQDATQQVDIVGTPTYMAPELFRSQSLTTVSDLYAVGCVAYEMITGVMPFEADSLHATISKHLFDMPNYFPDHLRAYPTLTSTVLKLLAKEPADRFQRADDVIQMLKYWNAPQDYVVDSFNESSTVSIPLRNLVLPTAAPQINQRHAGNNQVVAADAEVKQSQASHGSFSTLTSIIAENKRVRALLIPKTILSDPTRARESIELLVVFLLVMLISFLLSPILF